MNCENCGDNHDGKYGSGRFCSSKCARGFSTKNKRKDIKKKISESLKTYYKENGSPITGRKLKPLSDEHKKKISNSLKIDLSSLSEAELLELDKKKKAANKAGVYLYRARLKNAIPEDSDLKLIKLIYENCPEGYHVDHIVALASGGLHHQDNLQYLEKSENCRKGKGSEYDITKAIPWKNIIKNY